MLPPLQLGSQAGTDGGEGEGKANEYDIDRLSSLPECVLLHILTFLPPPKEAVKTALISPRFRYLWAFLPTLSFDICSYHNCILPHHKCIRPHGNAPRYDEDFLGFVNSMLVLYQGNTVDKFRLRLDFYFYHTMGECSCQDHQEFVLKEKRLANAITTWLLFALRKNVKFLHLDFGWGVFGSRASYRLPVDVFSRGRFLRELKLDGCEIKLGEQSQIQLPSLKKLVLTTVIMDDGAMERILRGCLVLEELSFFNCRSLSRLAFRNPSVKSLTIMIGFCNAALEITCPNIESLNLFGDLCGVNLVDVSSVAGASLYHFNDWVCKRQLSHYCLNAERHFEKLTHCKSFRVSASHFQILNVFQRADLSFACKYLQLQLSLIQEEWKHLGISNVLKSSPLLETVEISIYHKRPNIFEFDEPLLLQAQYHHNHSGEFWSSQEGSFHCLQHHLKSVRIQCDVMEPYLMEFIEFLIKNAMVLEKLVVSTKDDEDAVSTEQKLEAFHKLRLLPRASRCAVVDFS